MFGVHLIDAVGSLGVEVRAESIGFAARSRPVAKWSHVVGGEGTRKKAESQYDGNQSITSQDRRRGFQRSDGWRR